MTQEDVAGLVFLIGLAFIAGAFLWSCFDLVTALHHDYRNWKERRVEAKTKALEVFVTDSGGGYEWAELHVYRHPREQDKYAVDFDSGCSCDGYYPPTVEALESYQPWTKAAAREVLIKFLRDNPYYFSTAAALDEIERFTTTVN